MSHRDVHGGLGVGGSAFITGGESSGSLIDVELYPGGVFGAYGLRVEARGFGQIAPESVLAGLTYEAAIARPRLVLALFAVAGLSFDTQPMISTGVQTQLAVIGPLALGLEANAILIVDGTADTALFVGSSLSVRLAL